jgi:6-pyruvoyltetrahydropterin/6-carboxytetrahydropterin synthase
MIRLTRVYRFSASHRLHARALSDAMNLELYGKCNHPYGHGHNYAFEVSVEGPLDPSGRVANPLVLDRLVNDAILKSLDHRNLNTDVGELLDTVPTTENLVDVIRRKLAARWHEAFPAGRPSLARLRIRETRKNTVEWNSTLTERP